MVTPRATSSWPRPKAWPGPAHAAPSASTRQTRDIVQTIYIRKVEKVAGKLQNVEFENVPNFKDPGKQ